MHDLDAILTLRPLAPDRFRVDVPDGWQQGRGAFGGLVVALLVRAAEAALADPSRPLRSLSAELCAPTLPGPTDIRVEILRAGSGATTLAVRMIQADEVTAHASAVFARVRDPEVRWTELAAPTPPAFDTFASFLPEGAPVFARHLDMRPVHAPVFAGADDTRTEGWIRFRHPPATLDVAVLAMLCDVWWPAAFARLTTPRPTATIAFTFQPLADLAGRSPGDPVIHRAHSPATRGGYSVELRELWSAAGELLALNQQTFAVIR